MSSHTIELSKATVPQLNWLMGQLKGIETRNNFLVEYDDGDAILEFLCHADSKEHAFEQCLNFDPDCTPLRAERLPAYNPAGDLSTGMDIAEQEKIDLQGYWETNLQGERLRFVSWHAVHSQTDQNKNRIRATGRTQVEAAVRCHIRAVKGDRVTVPDVL